MNILQLDTRVVEPGQVNPHIQVRWITFPIGHSGRQVKLRGSGFVILSNKAVTSNPNECSIREQLVVHSIDFVITSNVSKTSTIGLCFIREVNLYCVHVFI